MSSLRRFDFVIAGGGLQGCLLVHAIRFHQPEASVLLVERNSELCGNHTWSFHRTDLSDQTYRWFQNIVDSTWPNYEVRLKQKTRKINIPYGSIDSTSLAGRTQALLDEQRNFQRMEAKVVALHSQQLQLEGGQTVDAKVVLDCRGVDRTRQTSAGCGFQKFVGWEVELSQDWDSTVPCLMDDTVDQNDGFRFMYTLPFGPRRVLVEDTRFSNSPSFDENDCAESITRYLHSRGHEDFRIRRKESGCLPMPYLKSKSNPLTALGYRGGFFHPATGYSIPLAANLADQLAGASPEKAANLICDFRRRYRGQHQFSLWLNRLLFRLVRPNNRADIFRRFYATLGEDSIARFYGHRFTIGDALQIVVGRPPAGLTPIRFINSFREKPCPTF